MKKLLVFTSFFFLFISCNQTESTSESRTDEVAIITTNYGEIHLILYDETPQHKENFLKLASEGFYDSTAFHRVINQFMIQGGDPNSKDDIPFNDGQGGPGYTIEAEIVNHLVHKKGAVAAARLGDQANPEKRSSGSQFYIVHGQPFQSMQLDQFLAQRNQMEKEQKVGKYLQAPENAQLLSKLQQQMQQGMQDSVEAELARIEQLVLQGFIPVTYSQEQRAAYGDEGGTPFLDGNYTVFGEVIQGLEIVDIIATQQTDEADRPLERIVKSIRVETMAKKDITDQYGYIYQ
ncbi:MAG: peptidylprolyl isomerase [Balneolales bacterium]|nr:peptidylprolyl isomerase [Balneolales bacterium]